MTVHFGVKTSEGLQRGAAEPFQYPGGEWHLKNIIDNTNTPEGSVWIADVRGASTDDLILAALFAQVAHGRQQPFVLFLPYLPAARSDRGEPTGAIVYSDFVRSMNPQQVIGVDAHSTVIEQLMQPKLTALSPLSLILRALHETGGHYDAIIAPDHGAVGRARVVAEVLGVPLHTADKKRDFETGKIESITIEGVDVDKSYLVVDDICDGGGTFMGLAEATGLSKERLGLWITHGIFSGKADQLRSAYEHIYTTDSHPGYNRVGVATTVVPCEAYLLQNLKKFEGRTKNDH